MAEPAAGLAPGQRGAHGAARSAAGPDAGSRGGSLREWWPALLIASCLVLLPVGRLVEGPVLLMAALGLALLVRKRTAWLASPAFRLFTAVFLACWLPIVLSVPDAVQVQHSLSVAVNHLRFYLSGIFMLHVLCDAAARERLLMLCGWLLAFWVVDAWVQIVFGVDLFGRRPWPGGVSGIFGHESAKFGTTLAVFSPLLCEYARRHWPWWALTLIVLATLYAVMSAGSRLAWVTMVVVMAAYVVLYARPLLRVRLRVWIAALLVVSTLLAGAYHLSEPFQRRADQSIGELTGRTPVLTSPLAHRWYIWLGAVEMIKDNPINGVGARGFRYAFEDYAVPEDPFVRLTPPVLPTHSHHLLLEIGAETGVIGLVGLLLAGLLAARAAWRATPEGRRAMLPYGIALIAAYFPLNTHYAIYGSQWAQIVWWLIGVYCASFIARDGGHNTAGSPVPPFQRAVNALCFGTGSPVFMTRPVQGLENNRIQVGARAARRGDR